MRRAALGLLLCWACLIVNTTLAAPPPVITQHPQSQTVPLGATVTFLVEATSGTALTYQWYFQAALIAGATNNTYTVSNAQFTNAGTYYVAVRNAGGTVNSSNAVLTIKNAPVLAGANNFSPVSQNDFTNAGTRVSSLIAGKVTDPDPGAVQGIAVVAVDNASGTWQFSTNGGSSWSAFANPSPGVARLLAADTDTFARFVPNTNWVGTVTNAFTFRAWDQTSGAAGGTADVTTNGGATAFSASTASSSISVVNYAFLFVNTANDVLDGTTTSIGALLENKGPDGRISLREAILAANNTINGPGGLDAIYFSIPDPVVNGAHTINLTSALPVITDSVIIDGTIGNESPTAGPVIELSGAGAGTGVNGLTLQADGCSVRGLAIDQFSGNGLVLSGSSNTAELLWIGVGVNGLSALGNGQAGMLITGSKNTVGGREYYQFNVIGGNAGPGILINGATATGNVMINNNIGLGYDSLTLLTNAQGVRIENGASSNRIGTAGIGLGNRIAGSAGAGIAVLGANTVNNAFLGNRILANGGLAIDLNNDGVTLNDAGDGDTGPSRLQNFPVLASATVMGSSLSVTGTLNSATGLSYRVEFFRVLSGQADPTGYGEADSFLGQVSVTTSGTGIATFNAIFNGVVIGAGDTITATATRDLGGGVYGDTSECAQNIGVTFVGTPGFDINVLSPCALGNEVRANTTTNGDQWNYYWSSRTVAVASNGSFVKVWIDRGGADGNKAGIFGQRFDADGNKVSGEFLVNTTTSGDQDNGSVAMDGGGNFVVCWDSGGDIYGQRFLANGTRIDGEFLVNTTTGGTQRYPEVDYAPDGSFLVVWSGPNPSGGGNATLFQRYAADGTKIGGEMVGNVFSGTSQIYDSLSVRNDGSFLITWTDAGDIYGCLFNSNGAPTTAPLLLNATTAGTQQYSVARTDGAGNFVVAWESLGQDGSGNGVFARRFAPDGTPLTGEFACNSQTAGDQYGPAIAMDRFGNFVVAWTDGNALDGSAESVWIQRFDATGQRIGPPKQVNQTTDGYQGYPVLAMNNTGRLVVGWEGVGPGDNYGIYVRPYQLDPVVTEGSNTTFTVALSTPPTALVTLNLSVSDATEASLSTSLLTFSPAYWSLPQTVTLTGVQDRLVDGDTGLTIITGSAASADPAYNGLNPEDIPMITLDSGVPNTAPVLDSSRIFTLTPITEDQTTNAGNTVAEIIASAGGDRITDDDPGALEGIAITEVVSNNGTWQYSTNGGNTWTNVGAVADNSALLLRATDKLRFVPDALNGDVASLTFRAWDQTSGTAGSKADVSVNGATTAFSTATATASITVTAVNDAPINTTPVTQVIREDTPLVFSSANGNAISIADPDAGSNLVMVTLTAGNGTLTLAQTTGLTFTTGDGTADTNMTFSGTIVAVNAGLAGMSYIPTANFSGTASVQIVTDDLGYSGSGEALSDSDTVAIIVQPVNAASWYQASWLYRKAITIYHTNVTADLTNFPVLISRTDSDLQRYALTNGYDLLFTSADGTNKLAHEIERYASSSGTLVAWVKVPWLSITADTVLYLYYGNVTATNQQNATNVWDTDFRAVWHFRESSGTSLADATAFINNGTLAASPNTPVWGSDGQIGSALSFDGANDYVTIPHSASLNVSNRALTISGWYRVTNTASDQVIFGKFYNSTMTSPYYQYGLEFQSSTRQVVLYLGSSGNLLGPWGVAPIFGTWQYIAFTYNGTNVIGYLNNATPIATPQTASITARTQGLRMGEDNSNAQPYLGAIDELRVSGVARSAAWLAAEYANQSSPGTFAAVGGPEVPIPIKLAVASINGGSSPVVGNGFTVAIQAQEIGGTPAHVTSDSTVTLSLKTGSGTLTGTLTGTITNGTSSVTLSGVTYSKAESGVVLTANRTSGDILVPGDSSAFSVIYQADVAVTVFGATNIAAGANLTYTLTVTNAGPHTSSNLVVSDTPPIGSTFYGASSGGSYTSGIVTWPAINLDSGKSTNYFVTITTPAGGPLTNVASCTAATSDANPSNNDGSASSARVITAVNSQGVVAVSSTNYAYTNATTLTWSHTVGTGNNRLLLVAIVTGSSTTISSDATTVTNVTYGGTALAQVGTVVEVGNRVRCYIFKMVNPPVGTANVVVRQVASRPVYGGATTFTGVDQMSPLGAFASYSVGTPAGVLGGAASAALTGLTSSANELVFDVVGVDEDGTVLTLSPGTGQSALWTQNRTNLVAGGSSTKAGAASVDLAWTWSPTDTEQYVMGAVPIRPSPPPQADVVTTVSGASGVLAGGNLTYNVVVTNLGPATATNIVVSNTLPAGATFVSASGGGTNANGVVLWAIASLTNAVPTNFLLTVAAPPTGWLTNSVSSAALTSDPDPSNNNGSAASARVVTVVYSRPTLTGQRLPNGAFQIEFATMPNSLVTIQASTNLADWVPLVTTNSGNGFIRFIDQDAASYSMRFYRSAQTP